MSIRPILDLRPRAGWLAILALVYLWPVVLQPGGVLLPARSDYTDLLVSHWPNALWIRRALFAFHEPPLWNPAILGGQPFAADPLAGLWYPPDWLLWLPGPPLGLLFNVLFIAHLAWGGWGMFRFLLDREGRQTEAASHQVGAALIGAAAFMGLPKWTAHLAAGHVSLCFAVAWTPWLLAAVRRAARSAQKGEAANAAAVFALLFLADVRWAAYAGLLAGAYWAWLAWPGPDRPALRRSAAGAALFALGGVALTAVLWLPLAEFQRLASRAALTAPEAAAYSLPPRYLAGLLLPDLGGFHEWQTYLGWLPLVLAIFGALARGPQRSDRAFWVGAAAVAALFSLGDSTPFFPLIVRLLPPLGWLRVPPRAWFVVGFAVCVLAARGAESLAAGAAPRPGRRFRLAAFAVAALAWGLAGGAWAVAGRSLPNLILMAVAATVALGLIAARSSSRLGPSPFLSLAALAVVLDLGLVNATFMRAVPESQAFERGQAVADFLNMQANRAGADGFRVYSPSYSLPQHVAAAHGLEQADGVNPLQLAATVEFMSRATGVAQTGYSVTLPPFAGGDPATANTLALPAPARLGLLGVRYLVAEFDVRSAALLPLERFGETRLYENPLARPRAWVEFAAVPAANRQAALDLSGEGVASVEGAVGLAGSGNWIPARTVQRGVNFLAIETVTEQPGLLVTAEVAYPGWWAWVDGRPEQIVRVDGLLRGVFIPAGRHAVRFQFLPVTVFVGAGISAVAWLGLAVMLLWRRASRGRS